MLRPDRLILTGRVVINGYNDYNVINGCYIRKKLLARHRVLKFLCYLTLCFVLNC